MNSDLDFHSARYPTRLGLPAGESQSMADAAKAIRQEYRDSSKRKRLGCSTVSVFAERQRGAVYVLHIDQSVEFDWTWERARAFQYDNASSEQDHEQGSSLGSDRPLSWSGEILEVDQQERCAV